MYKKDFYFIVLKELTKNGLLRTTDLSKVTAAYLADQNNVLDPVWTNVDRAVKELFLEFIANKHIKSFVDNTPHELRFDAARSYTLHIQVYAELTLAGFSFYKDYKRNNRTLKYALCALVIAVFTFGVDTVSKLRTYILTQDKNKKESLRSNKAIPPIKKQNLLFPITFHSDSSRKQ